MDNDRDHKIRPRFPSPGRFLNIGFALLALLLASCQRVALDERFHNPSLGKWTVVDDPDTIEGPSSWRVEDGRLRQQSNIWGRRGDFLGRWYGSMLVAGDPDWKDYTLSVKALPDDNDGFGVVFRFVDPQHFYRLFFIEGKMNGGPITRLDKRNGDDYTQIWSLDAGYKPGSEMNLAVDLQASEIKVTLNGSVLVEIKDDSYSRGKIGLFCFAQNGQVFDDVRVTLK